MPFGLRNTGSNFQRFIDNLFIDLSCVFIYIDDILVFSEDETQHNHDLCTVLTILDDDDLRVSLGKCIFFADEVDFLGFELCWYEAFSL